MGNSPSTVESSPGIRSYRDEKPKDYILKIQDFSWPKRAVCTGNNNRYESKIFDAGGYKWKLALYPNRDGTQINGSNHISLYLVTVEDDILSGNSELNILFTFLIYDNIRDRYLTIQDSKIRRFHSIKTEWGFEKLVSLSDFSNVSNGFLVNDCCVFGVDIVVLKSNEGKGEVLSLAKRPKNNTLTWKVTDFFDKKCHKSDPYKVESYNWQICLYPRGDDSKEATGFLSMYLIMQNFKDLPQGFRVYVEYEMAILGRPGFDATKSTIKQWFDSEVSSWGLRKFISTKVVEGVNNGFLHDNNTVMVQVKINAINAICTSKHCF